MGLRIATALLEAGARSSALNNNNETVLHVVSQHGLHALANLLLSTDPAATACVNQLDRNKESALSIAAKNGNLQLTTVLLKHGAHVSITEDDVKEWAENAKTWLNVHQQRRLVIENEIGSVVHPLKGAVDSNNPELVQALIEGEHQTSFFYFFLLLSFPTKHVSFPISQLERTARAQSRVSWMWSRD